MATARLINTNAVIDGVDDETFGNNETGSANRTTERLLHNPDHQELTFLMCKWGGEVRVELTVGGRRNEDDSVEVDAHAFLFEGTSEETTDLDGEIHYGFTVPKGQTHTDNRRVTNLDEGGDFADITLTVINRVFEG
jgi:hypothetical protein